MKGGDSDSEAMEVDSHTNGLGQYELVYRMCIYTLHVLSM